MWKAYKANRFEQYVDLEDPYYKDIKVKRFYKHHPKDGYLLEVDARAIKENFDWEDNEWAFSRMEEEADRLNLYYRKIILTDGRDILMGKTHMVGHSVMDRETKFVQQTHSSAF